MTTNKLYITGNGFDLHHNIRSSYSEFGEYVKEVDSELHETFEEYFSFEGNWADLETTLAYLDADSIIDYASNFLVSYGAEDWSDAYHHNYQYEVNRIVESLSKGLKKVFTDWVINLHIPEQSSCPVPLLNLDQNSLYLNFNYTNTLHKIYQIPTSNVVYIHNKANGQDSDLILGHAFNPKDKTSLNEGAELADQDVRVTEGNDIIDSYFSATYKPTQKIINANQSFFNSLTGINQIIVAGHSLSEVDFPYFERVIMKTAASDPCWLVTCRSKKSETRVRKTLSALGIRDEKIECICMESI